ESFISIVGQHSSDTLPLDFPLFIKPLGGGGGRGVGDDSVVRSFEEFQDKVRSIRLSLGSSSLVERYLEGREFSVAILDSFGLEEAMVMPIEIITTQNHHGDRVLGSRVKREDHERVTVIHND